MLNPIFIIGCPRSGTTILGEFFEIDSQFDYYREKDIWKKPFQKNKESVISQKIFSFALPITRKSLKLSIFLKSIRLGIIKILKFLNLIRDESDKEQGHRLTEKDVTEEKRQIARSYLGKKRLVVKKAQNSLRIPFIKKIFPDAKFVHIIRDGRDVTCSLMNSPSGFFWSYIKPPGWKEKKKELKGLLRCAWQWKTTIEIINNDKKNIPTSDFIELKYEELIENPEKTIKNLFEELRLSFRNEQLITCQKIKNKLTLTDLAFNDKATILDHTFRVGRYKKELSSKQLAQIEAVLGLD